MPRHGNPKLDRLPERLRAAIRHNLQLCASYCATAPAMDASCASINAAAELDAMIIGNFVEKPCPFETGGSPTLAVPGGCLALFAPGAALARGSDARCAERDPELVCPRVALVRQGGGAVVVEPVAVAAHSISAPAWPCGCSAINLASDSEGRIEATPAENPPSDCISGHRSSAKQDILELRGRALRLRHRLDPRDPD